MTESIGRYNWTIYRVDTPGTHDDITDDMDFWAGSWGEMIDELGFSRPPLRLYEMNFAQCTIELIRLYPHRISATVQQSLDKIEELLHKGTPDHDALVDAMWDAEPLLFQLWQFKAVSGCRYLIRVDMGSADDPDVVLFFCPKIHIANDIINSFSYAK